jgi:hypothetical protein
MAKTVYLHIGMGRCGSSAIQSFAATNERPLVRLGVVYPDPSKMGFPPELARGGNATGLARSPSFTDSVARYIRDSAEDRCLLSSEFLYSWPLAQFQNLKQQFNHVGLNVIVVAYIREQREWLISRYAQGVKARRWTQSLESYLEQAYRADHLNFVRRFRPLRSVFGPDELIIRIFDRSRLREGDVRTDLCGILGIDNKDLDYTSSNDNASAGVLELEVMRLLNDPNYGKLLDNRRFLRISRELLPRMGWEGDADLYRLVPQKSMNRMAKYYAKRNEVFKSEFFPDVEGDLFANKIPQRYDFLPEKERLSARSLVLLYNYFREVTGATASPDLARAEEIIEMQG